MDEIAKSQQHPGWTLTFDLTVEELMRFNRMACRTARSGFISFVLLLVCAYFAAEISIRGDSASGLTTEGFMLTIAVMAGLYVMASMLYSKIYYRNYWPEGSAVLAPRQMSITAEGVLLEQQYSSGRMQWPAITQIIPDETAIYLMMGKGNGLVIPYRVLPADVTPAGFIKVLRSFKECAKV